MTTTFNVHGGWKEHRQPVQFEFVEAEASLSAVFEGTLEDAALLQAQLIATSKLNCVNAIKGKAVSAAVKVTEGATNPKTVTKETVVEPAKAYDGFDEPAALSASPEPAGDDFDTPAPAPAKKKAGRPAGSTKKAAPAVDDFDAPAPAAAKAEKKETPAAAPAADEFDIDAAPAPAAGKPMSAPELQKFINEFFKEHRAKISIDDIRAELRKFPKVDGSEGGCARSDETKEADRPKIVAAIKKLLTKQSETID